MQTIKLNASTIYFGDIEKIEFQGSILIVTEKNIAPLYLQSLLEYICADSIFTLVLDGGEQNKNFTSLQKILNTAFECGLDRQSAMIALGGGVISDLVGLASGLYMRGIKFINIPTTLLSQVDASVGGKCGINSSFGKNLIGLFYHPHAVFISPHFLDSLPSREFNAGMAEIIKMAICFSPTLFEKLFDPAWIKRNLLEIIFQSVSIKTQVVAQDEKEQNLRSALNYGHTFGHAIEKEQNFTSILHGEAVSIGMVMANSLASRLIGFKESDSVISLLKLHHLPTTYKIQNIKNFKESLYLDKKTKNKEVKFILPKTIGSFDFIYPSIKEITKTLSEFTQ